MAIVIIVKTENGDVVELPVLDRVSLGRSSNNDYKIVDSKMSASHCILELTPRGELLFKDLDSTNGSFLNNSRIHHSVMVKINDIIQIGNTTLKINERLLTSAERIIIGSTFMNSQEEKTLPNMTPIGKHARAKADGDEKSPVEKRRSIVLGDVAKEKKKVPETWVGVDNILDQEVSTGNTKLLKLAESTEKKKRK